MLQIKETIVVEGKGDARNLSRVCNANYIITSGLHISKETYSEIELAINSNGIIIFTDPDSPGRTIRRKITERFSNKSNKIKHAYISVKEGKKSGDVGVENASEEALFLALSQVRCHLKQNASSVILSDRKGVEWGLPYTIHDLYELGLAGSPDSAMKRQKLCEHLRIGYSNAKSLCKKLNAYQISKSEIKKVTSL